MGADAGAWAEAQRRVDMLNRDAGLAYPQSEGATNGPVTCATKRPNSARNVQLST
jgi:hypothetical protein